METLTLTEMQKLGEKRSRVDAELKAAEALGDDTTELRAKKAELDSLAEEARRSFRAVGSTPTNALPTGQGMTVREDAKITFKPKSYYGRMQNLRNNEEGYRTADFLAHWMLSLGRPSIDETNFYRKELVARHGGEWDSRRGYVRRGMETRALAESVNSAGGFLVPVEIQNNIITLIEDFGVARKHANLVPMMTDTLLWPRYNQNMTAYWQTENSAITPSDIKLNQVGLNARTLTALGAFSNQLSEDAMVPLGDYLAGLIARIFAYNEDLALFVGDGTSTYGGIIGLPLAFTNAATIAGGTNPGVYTGTTSGAGTDWTKIPLGDITGLMGKTRLYPGAKWAFYCSNAFYQTVLLRLMSQGGGNTIQTLYGGTPDAEALTLKTFMGYPVIITEVMPTTASASQAVCYFGDMSQAVMFGERRMMTIALSTEAGNAFANNQTLIRGVERLDINVHDVGAETLDMSGNHIAGPLVQYVSANS